MAKKNRAKPIKWDFAPEVKAIAEELIEQVPEHRDLLKPGVRIEYVFVDRLPKSGGKQTIGQARKVSSLNAFLAASNIGASKEDDNAAPPFFVMCIYSPVWQFLKDEQRRSLVDHELCHMRVESTEDGIKLGLRKHDVEEFAGVIARNGVQFKDMEQILAAVTQHGQTALKMEDAA